MTTFALVTEGITDQVVIEAVLDAFYSDVAAEDVDVNILQPLRDETDIARQGRDSFGGWENVLEHVSLPERMSDALQFNDYLVVQIDTDCCGHKNFDVATAAFGKELPIPEIVDAVKTFIISKIDPEIYRAAKDRIIFAVGVHSTECWLLPLYAKKEQHIKKTQSCEHHLAHYVNLENQDYSKDYACYVKLVAPLRKRPRFNAAREKCKSLDIFLSDLPVI